MSRKRLPVNKIKVNTKIRIRKDLKDLAKEQGINFSQLMEKTLLEILKDKINK